MLEDETIPDKTEEFPVIISNLYDKQHLDSLKREIKEYQRTEYFGDSNDGNKLLDAWICLKEGRIKRMKFYLNKIFSHYEGRHKGVPKPVQSLIEKLVKTSMEIRNDKNKGKV